MNRYGLWITLAASYVSAHAQRCVISPQFTCWLDLEVRTSQFLEREPGMTLASIQRLDPAARPLTPRLAQLWGMHRSTLPSDACAVVRADLAAALERWILGRLHFLLQQNNLDSFAEEWSAVVAAQAVALNPQGMPDTFRSVIHDYLLAVRRRLSERLLTTRWMRFASYRLNLVDQVPHWGRNLSANAAMVNWSAREVYFPTPGVHDVLDLEMSWFHELAHVDYAVDHPLASGMEQERQAWTHVSKFLRRLSRTVPESNWSESLRQRYRALSIEGAMVFTQHVFLDHVAE